MQVAIIKTMNEGRALSQSELANAEHIKGELILENWDKQGMVVQPARRARLVSTILGIENTDVVPPLLEPEIITVKENSLTLVGYETTTQIDAPQRMLQIWLVKPMLG